MRQCATGRKIALLGYQLRRAAGAARRRFEHRLAAVIAVDGVYDMSLTVRAGVGDDPDLERRLRAEDAPSWSSPRTKAPTPAATSGHNAWP